MKYKNYKTPLEDGFFPVAGGPDDPHSLGYIYVIGFEEEGIVKIGMAGAPTFRLKELQCGCPFELKIYAVISIYDVDPFVVEQAAHKLARDADAHIRGEWFQLEVDEAIECVIAAARKKRARYGSIHAARARSEEEHDWSRRNQEQRRLAALRRRLGMDEDTLDLIENL